MAEWKVYLNGQNFLIKFDGTPTRLGFFVTRYVTADDSQGAEDSAVQYIRDELMDIVLNDKSDTPMIYAKEVVQIEPDDDRPAASGFTYYSESEQE